jgi:hypothetical protein
MYLGSNPSQSTISLLHVSASWAFIKELQVITKRYNTAYINKPPIPVATWSKA